MEITPIVVKCLTEVLGNSEAENIKEQIRKSNIVLLNGRIV